MTEPDHDESEVLAAGGVVLRPDADGVTRVLAVHRPAYDDWSLPKGKLDPGESWQEAAVREVLEETGVTGRLGVELTPTHHRDRTGRPKRVRWWTMTLVDEAARTPDGEVDQVRWLDVDHLDETLTHDTDRALVADALASRDDATVLVVRHGHAGERDQWDRDDGQRSLSHRGQRQAKGLLAQLGPWHVTRILTSPLVRCAQTVAPLADALGLPLEHDERLAEGAAADATAALVAAAGPGTVLCSHGDVIGTLVDGLVRDGVVAADGARWAKGSTWVLRVARDGTITDASYLAPPT